MFAAVVLTALQLAAPSATAAGDAPDRLFTTQGVEIRSDERVFVLFAALNGLGYAEETQRKGPPLRAPVYHPIRVQVRDALRKADEAGMMAGIRQMFEEHPAEIETYLEAVLADSEANLSPEAKKIGANAVQVLDAFRQKAELAKLFDTIAVEQRNHAKDLKTRLEKDFLEASKMLGMPAIRGASTLVVVPNPLDSHGAARVVAAKDRTYVIAGPGFKGAERLVLEATLRNALRPAADAAWGTPSGQKYAKHWDTLKSTPKIANRWSDGKAYLADTLAKLFTFKVRAAVDGVSTKDTEDEFLDDLNRENLRWSRFVMRALDGFDKSEPLETALPKLLAKSYP